MTTSDRRLNWGCGMDPPPGPGYENHSAAARELAEEHFDSDRVLADLLVDLGVD